MGKYGKAVGGDVVLSVVMYNSGCFGIRINAPFFCQPPSVQCIGRNQADSGDQYDYKCVHNSPLSLIVKLWNQSQAMAGETEGENAGSENKKTSSGRSLCQKTKSHSALPLLLPDIRSLVPVVRKSAVKTDTLRINRLPFNGGNPVRVTVIWFAPTARRGWLS